jgi:hypothetical protein
MATGIGIGTSSASVSSRGIASDTAGMATIADTGRIVLTSQRRETTADPSMAGLTTADTTRSQTSRSRMGSLMAITKVSTTDEPATGMIRSPRAGIAAAITASTAATVHAISTGTPTGRDFCKGTSGDIARGEVTGELKLTESRKTAAFAERRRVSGTLSMQGVVAVRGFEPRFRG